MEGVYVVILKSNIHAIGTFFFNPGNRLKYNAKNPTKQTWMRKM